MAGPKYASAKYSIAQCDRCNFRYKLKDLRTQTLKTKPYKVKVCKTCWDPDQPQLQLGMYPVYDPQAVEEPRPDNSYLVSGQSGLQINNTGIGPDAGLTPNDLVQQVIVGTVTVTTTQE